MLTALDRALADAALVRSAPEVPGETKRDIVEMVAERVVCHRNGAEVHFLPGFGLSSFGLSPSRQEDGLGEGRGRAAVRE